MTALTRSVSSPDLHMNIEKPSQGSASALAAPGLGVHAVLFLNCSAALLYFISHANGAAAAT